MATDDLAGPGFENMGSKPVEYYHLSADRLNATVRSYHAGLTLRPWRVGIHLLSECCLACSYCRVRRLASNFVTIHGTTPWLGRPAPQCTSNALLRHCIQELGLLSVKHLHFTGGEPTLLDDLPDLICQASRLGMSTSLVTSGVSPNAASRDYCDALVTSGLGAISVSLDAIDPALCDTVTRSTGAHACAVDFLQNTKRLRTSDLPIRRPHVFLQMVVSRQSLYGIVDYIRVASELGINDVKLLLPKGDPRLLLPEAELVRFRDCQLDDAIAAAEHCGFLLLAEELIYLFGRSATVRDAATGQYYEPFDGPCYTIMSEMTIGCNGDVYPCIYHLWDGAAGPRANVSREPLSAIWAAAGHAISRDIGICRRSCTRRIAEFNRTVHGTLASAGRGREMQ